MKNLQIFAGALLSIVIASTCVVANTQKAQKDMQLLSPEVVSAAEAKGLTPQQKLKLQIADEAVFDQIPNL